MTKEHADIIAIARKRIDEAASVDRRNRDNGENDLRFVIGDQWPEAIKLEREKAGKPTITVNGLSKFVRQVTAQIRQMNPSIKVSASDQAATDDVAEIYEGLIRQIESSSHATNVYEGAGESAAACGIGHWRILTRYCDDTGFDQEIYIQRIYNPFSVFWDPLARESSRKDARYCFVTEEMAKDAFEAKYPKAGTTPLTDEDKGENGDNGIAWATADTVTVAEYMWIEEREEEIVLLTDGRSGPAKELPPDFPEERIAKRRKAKKRFTRWVKMTATDILEGPLDIASPFIPVVSVTGEEWVLGSEVYRSSVIRFAKDPQTLYNYARSAQAEVIALQPKAPYLATAKQIGPHAEMWRDANTSNRAVLLYEPDEKAGAPARIPPPIPSAALMSEIQLAAEDMKQTTGIYDASLGAQSNETSGVAIRARQTEAAAANSIYADNLSRAVAHTGDILVAMIPRIYDTQRVVRLLGQDGQEKAEVINAIITENGETRQVNDLTVGKYAVNISVGPSYQSKKQEASEGMMAFMQAMPQAAPLIADLIASAQDWPDDIHEKVAQRLRKALPQGMAEKEDDEGESPPDPMQAQQMQMQMQQQQAAMQAQQQMQAAELALKTAQAEKAQADAAKAAAEAQKAQMELAIMQQQVAAVTSGMVPVGQQPAGFEGV